MFKHSQREKILQSLQLHLDFFDAAARRHQLWIKQGSDPETEKVHLEILGLLRQTREEYLTLMERYKGPIG